ncbi:hypothetical protein N0V82_008494 [Gnomoniopsis sp. IMI 355080]|nr:hypothetical protein N0V82_008494 [Gnomoniopsis sp. IMI 355080]
MRYSWRGWLPELFLLASITAAQFNNPSGVDIWCGKAYRETNSSFDPGGWFEDPAVTSTPSLRLKAKSRMSIYLDTDAAASVLVDAEVVYYQIGEPISEAFLTNPAQTLRVTISSEGLSLGSAALDVGSTDNEVPISLKDLTPRLDPYSLTIQAVLANSTVYTASTNLSYLPYPESYGSVARLDNLYGGTYAQRGKNSSWVEIYPYTYYVQWSLYWDANVSTLNDFSSSYNMIHIVPTGTLGDSPFPWDQFQPYLDRAAELGIWLQYDILWTPDNLTSMTEQVTRLREHPSILSWYQSDEPDGKSNPLNSTGIAYNLIKELDPYHPISLALNCYDFYYEDYAAGADIITPDVYPISTNTSYSTVYETVCNATYGCCGCDDCGAGPTVFSDIPLRLDEFRRRDGLIGWAKTQWFAPQAFGNESFWTRYPTADELNVMTLLGVNHGAKGIVMWDYPTSSELYGLTNDMAALFTNQEAAKFLIGAPRTQDLIVTGGYGNIDAAVWVDADSRKALVTVVNLDYGTIGPLTVNLPTGVVPSTIEGYLWGNSTWQTGKGSLSVAKGLGGLDTAVFVVTLA